MALVPIREYGEKHGVSQVLMRQRCQRGAFKTARKLGTDWFVDDEEEFTDHRKTPENGIGGPGRRLIDARFRPSWADEFGSFWPDVKVCSGCVNAIRPKWLDLKLEGWDLMDVPYEEQRPVIQKVLEKSLCERCAERVLEAFDRMHE